MVVNRFEVPDVECFYIYSETSYLRVFSRFWHFGILFPLAAWGMTTKIENRSRLWILDAMLVIMIGAIVLFFILGRYRQPLVPMSVLFAAVAIWDISKRIRTRCWRSMRLSIAGFLSTAILSTLVHDESMLRKLLYEYGNRSGSGG